ncbi:MAG: hypothetical protein ACYS30_23850, partial [Planctomycetota bacterium]
MNRAIVLVSLLVVLVLAACSAEPETAEVTRVVTEISELEVTREIEVEVTRIIEVEVDVTREVKVEIIQVIEIPVTTTPSANPLIPFPDFDTLQELRARWIDWVSVGLDEIGTVEQDNAIILTPGRVVIELDMPTSGRDNVAYSNYYIVSMFAPGIAA